MKRAVALFLAAVFCCFSFFSCASEKNTVMSIEGAGSLSENFIYLLASMQKQMYSGVVEAYGGDFNMVIDEETGLTFADYIENTTLTSAKNSLICEYLHDKVYKLDLGDDKKVMVETRVSEMAKAFGSKAAFEEKLSAYSADMQTFERYLYLSLKQGNLYTHFYKDGGVFEIKESEIENYFKDNYVIVTNIYFNTLTKQKQDGTTVTLTEEEKQEKRRLAEEVYTAVLSGENFEELKNKYSEDYYEKEYYPNGFFVTYDGAFPAEFTKAAFELEVGECKLIETEESGIHIVKKLSMNSLLYNSDETVYSNIEQILIGKDFEKRINEYSADVFVNEELVSSLNIGVIPTFDLSI